MKGKLCFKYLKYIVYFPKRNLSSSTNCKDKPKLVAVSEAARFMIDAFKAVNVPQRHAEAQASMLIAADVRQHFSHGMNRLDMYIEAVVDKSTDGCAEPTMLKETAATAWVDGNNGLGAVIGNFCMDLAIKKAKEVGVGWVCAKRANHYGIAACYVERAMKNCLLGLTMTNTSPLMVRPGGKMAVLGTNPIGVGVQAANNDAFLMDMATTGVALGKIEIQKRKKAPIPLGWAQDSQGKVTTDAEVAFKAGCLLPLGGTAETGGFKGFALGSVVDILTGVMSGANYSTKIPKWRTTAAGEAYDLGHVFIAVDPNAFAPNFQERLADFLCRLRASADKDSYVAGDMEKIAIESTNKNKGIAYMDDQLKSCEALAAKLKIKPLCVI